MKRDPQRAVSVKRDPQRAVSGKRDPQRAVWNGVVDMHFPEFVCVCVYTSMYLQYVCVYLNVSTVCLCMRVCISTSAWQCGVCGTQKAVERSLNCSRTPFTPQDLSWDSKTLTRMMHVGICCVVLNPNFCPY